MTELDYDEMLERLFGRIHSELGITVSRYSFGTFQSQEYRFGDLTYDCDNGFQVEICRWYNWANHSCEQVPSPTPIVEPDEEAEFEDVLKEAVKRLLQKEILVDA